MSQANWSAYYGSYWKWDVYGQVTLKSGWSNLTYASVSYTITLADGQQQSFSGTTDNYGRLTIDWAFHNSRDIFPATITITSVSRWGTSYNPSPAQFTWNA